ncbi:MAG: hypothetical protein SNJ77_02620, partial [Cytophagales bacterium]
MKNTPIILLALVLMFSSASLMAENGKDKEGKKGKKECCATKKDKAECNKSQEKSCNKEKKS